MGQNNSRSIRSISYSKKRRPATKVNLKNYEKFEKKSYTNTAAQYVIDSDNCCDREPSSVLKEEYIERFSYVQ